MAERGVYRTILTFQVRFCAYCKCRCANEKRNESSRHRELFVLRECVIGSVFEAGVGCVRSGQTRPSAMSTAWSKTPFSTPTTRSSEPVACLYAAFSSVGSTTVYL